MFTGFDRGDGAVDRLLTWDESRGGTWARFISWDPRGLIVGDDDGDEALLLGLYFKTLVMRLGGMYIAE